MRWARVATVVGIVCAAGAAVAVPAMADSTLIDGTPCTKGARACVDLIKQKAWLIDPTGKVTRGPVPITSGGPGKETLPGTFKVIWKDKNHVSNEFKTPQGAPAPMPWSVFFAEGGVAFHGGSLERASAGCVHLADADAEAFYNTLQIGDQVQVHNGNDTPGAQDSGDASQARDDNPGQSGDNKSKPKRSAAPSNANQPDGNGDNGAQGVQNAAPTSDDSSANDGQPSSNDRPRSDSALDLNRSPVSGGALPHRL